MLNGRLDFQQHAVDILNHIIIPEPDDAITLADKLSGSPFISQVVSMLSTVQLDDQLELVAREVTKVSADGRLSAKMMRLEWWLTKVLPKYSLDVCSISSKQARAGNALV